MAKKKVLPPNDADAFQHLVDQGYTKKHLSKAANMTPPTFDKKLKSQKMKKLESENKSLKKQLSGQEKVVTFPKRKQA